MLLQGGSSAFCDRLEVSHKQYGAAGSAQGSYPDNPEVPRSKRGAAMYFLKSRKKMKPGQSPDFFVTVNVVAVVL